MVFLLDQSSVSSLCMQRSFRLISSPAYISDALNAAFLDNGSLVFCILPRTSSLNSKWTASIQFTSKHLVTAIHVLNHVHALLKLQTSTHTNQEPALEMSFMNLQDLMCGYVQLLKFLRCFLNFFLEYIQRT